MMKSMILTLCLVAGGAVALQASTSSARAEASDGAIVRDSIPTPAKAAIGAASGATDVTGSLSSQTGTERMGSSRTSGRALSASPEAKGRYRDLIARHAQANGIPFSLADAIVRIESRYNPGAHNGGAVGLMQIKTQTARGLGYSGGAAGLTNPDTNLRYGMLYLAQAYRLSGGNTCATVMRYQSGHYATRISGANRAYCSKARTIMASN
jgi:soluble lytic murein transglycosylase-like protein